MHPKNERERVRATNIAVVIVRRVISIGGIIQKNSKEPMYKTDKKRSKGDYDQQLFVLQIWINRNKPQYYYLNI